MAQHTGDYAIVVGINSYSQLRPLRAAHKDATEFAQWLHSPDGGGLPVKNVRLILSPDAFPADPLDATPVQKDIDKALRDFGVLNNRRIGRRLYFYFAGHGIGPTFDDVGLLMAPAAMNGLKRNIGLRPYRLYFHDHFLFDELVFILDCCRDPAHSVETAGPDFTIAHSPVSPVNDFVILAAAYGEKAFEPTDKVTDERRGLLTRAVLEGLQKPEAADSQGRFTAYTLREYVKKRVPALAKDEKLRQEPDIPLPEKDILFSTLPVGQLAKVNVRIAVTEDLGGSLILRDNAMQVIEERPAVVDQPPWNIRLLRNRWYAVEHTASEPGTPPAILDLRNVKHNPYVFHFPRPG
ncbi:MAG: caspase family protein [Ferruginibacter sp.]|nr:caspase family protein [Cytophagales bacterium]